MHKNKGLERAFTKITKSSTLASVISFLFLFKDYNESLLAKLQIKICSLECKICNFQTFLSPYVEF